MTARAEQGRGRGGKRTPQPQVLRSPGGMEDAREEREVVGKDKPGRRPCGCWAKRVTAPPPTSQAGSRDSIQGARTRSGRGFGKVGSLRPRAVEPAGPAALAVAAVAAVRQQLQWPRRVEV